MNFWWLLVVVSYLLGSFSTARLVGWLVGHNPTKAGSGNPGATNIYRLAGYKAGGIVLCGDVLKAVIPTLLTYLLVDKTIAVACGAAVVVGHIFPVFMKFKGGKGVACYGGLTVALHPLIGAAGITFWFLVVLATKFSSLASILTISFVVGAVALRGRPAWEIAVFGGLVLLIVSLHAENIKRLMKGTESRINLSRKRTSEK